MASDRVIENSLRKKQDDSLGKYLLILVVIFAAFWEFNNYYSSKAPSLPSSPNPAGLGLADNEKYVAEQVGMLLAKNPNMAKEDATDKVIYDIAIQEKNKTLCGRLRADNLKNRCLKYFIINGLN